MEESLGALGSPNDASRGNVGYIAICTAMAPEPMANAPCGTVRAIDPQLALDQVQTMEQAASDSEAPRRFNTALISAFAGMRGCKLLAALGIYGSVIAFSGLALLLQEMAIRMGLASQRSGILRLVLGSAAKLALAGCVVGRWSRPQPRR